MEKIIEHSLSLIQSSNYPSKKEWFSKFNYPGLDYEKLLTYKREHLKKIPTQTECLYFNEDLIMPKVKDFYPHIVMNFDQLDFFMDQIESILIFSEVEHSLSIEGVKSSRKKI